VIPGPNRWFMKYKQFRDSANAVFLVGLIGWALFTLLKVSSFPGQPFGGDYGLNLLQSTQVLEGHSFPSDFTYPLPCILLRYYLFKIGGNYSGIVWVCMIAFAMFFIVRFLIKEFYVGGEGSKYIYLMLSFLPVAYYIQWDIKALNCNLIVLCSVMVSALYLKKRSYFLSGFFLSLGVALKLYPIVILPYLIIKKKFRPVLSALLWIGILFVLFPVIVLGKSCFIELTGKWIESVASTGSPDYLVKVIAYKTSLHYAILSFISQGNLLALSTRSLEDVKQLMFLLKVLFAVLAVIYLIFDLREPSLPKEVDHDLFNIILILLGSLLFSELLQPHHGVFLLAPSLFIMNFSLYGSFPKSVRYSVLALALLPAVVLKAASPGMEKAFAMNIHIIVYILVLIFLRFYITSHAGLAKLNTVRQSAP
jgi:hypothetical protein